MNRSDRKPVTKQGEHGTLYRYQIKYKDEYDLGSPTLNYNVWAYSQEHAEEKFMDSEDSDGWAIVEVVRVYESNGPRFGNESHAVDVVL